MEVHFLTAGKSVFYKKLFSLVLPIAFQQFMLAAVSASDALMLGVISQDDLSAVFFLASLFAPSLLMRIFTPEAGLISRGVEYLRIVSASYLFTGISQIYCEESDRQLLYRPWKRRWDHRRKRAWDRQAGGGQTVWRTALENGDHQRYSVRDSAGSPFPVDPECDRTDAAGC